MDLPIAIHSVPLGVLFAALVLFPVVTGLLCLVFRTPTLRTAIVLPTTWVLAAAALVLSGLALTGGRTQWAASGGGADLGLVATGASIVVLAYVAVLGVLRRSVTVIALALAQLAALAWFEIVQPVRVLPLLLGGIARFGASTQSRGMGDEVPIGFAGTPLFHVDWLSVVMVCIVSIIGSIIVVYALPYMKTHEEQHPVAPSKQPRFFFVMLLFLGAMNGLAMADDLRWLHLFWEITTLCSFFLIGHDGTEEAKTSAYRALWMNMLGGAGFVGGLILLPHELHTYSVQQVLTATAGGAAVPMLLLGLACLCFAGFTKSAQLPFGGWLLGAMVAPTPVSALLHSSTMVKAGVYLVMRFAPAFHGTMLSNVVVLAGGFTFAATALLAIGQTNAKRVLAYSTISNLGLIIACAGLNTPMAMIAAMMLLIFHAGSKALLFLCTGTVEHHIRSRDIEDMYGLVTRMPYTTALMGIGILSMLLPPFGFLIAKVAAIEAAMTLPIALVLLVPGSALTVVFWVKWIGRLVSVRPGEDIVPEKLPSMEAGPLLLLTGGAIASVLLIMPLVNYVVEPAVLEYQTLIAGAASATLPPLMTVLNVPWWPIIGVLTAAVVLPLWLIGAGKERRASAYLCGEQTAGPVTTFLTVADEPSQMSLRAAYFESWVGENKHRVWMASVATVLIVLVFASSWSVR